MNKLTKYILIGLIAAFAIIQLFGPSRPENRTENPADLLATVEVSNEISGLLRSACYDCHSMETKYPWYGYVAPISWYLFEHIEHGREELNFSEWGSMDKRRKIRKLSDLVEEVEEGKMPLEDYVTLHSEANLSEVEREALINWAKDLSEQVFSE